MTLLKICAVVLATQLGSVATKDIRVIALSDETDPVYVARGEYGLIDGTEPALRLTLSNRMREAVNTRNIWITFSRFFTWDEMRKNRNILMDCGSTGHITRRTPEHIIYPGDQTTVLLPIPMPCRLDHAHEHFFAFVDQVTKGVGSGEYAIWKHDPGDPPRLRVLFSGPHP
jgi:hypothetical protein